MMADAMHDTALDHAPVRVLAPLVFAAEFAIGALIQGRVPLSVPHGAYRWFAGAAPVAAGLAIGASALAVMRRAGTSPNPHVATSALVEAGPYRFTRNPMYLSMVLIFAGLACLLLEPWALFLLPFAVIVVDRWVIRPEERYLAAKFGEPYAGYMRRVRRWI
jgi:protein-S-isoprenylcysteine O-methyltransferase Ste14